MTNGDIFLFLGLGIVSLKLKKTHTFAIGNMTQYRSSKWANNPLGVETCVAGAGNRQKPTGTKAH